MADQRNVYYFVYSEIVSKLTIEIQIFYRRQIVLKECPGCLVMDIDRHHLARPWLSHISSSTTPRSAMLRDNISLPNEQDTPMTKPMNRIIQSALLPIVMILLSCISLAQAQPAAQGRRIALVIGNSDYQHPDNLPKLTNPVHDAEDIAQALRGFGFEVIEKRNQTREAMESAIAEFGSKIGGSEAALFYFAGHGIQVKNQNFLMPVNARIESEAAVPYQGVDVNRILDEMENGKINTNIVMLDACRNNPISGKFRSGKMRGLAVPGGAPKGTVIVYATDPGNVASDGVGRNGLFTAGLLTAFKGQDHLTLDDVLTVASAEVERASNRTQTPYVNGPKTLQKNFHFRLTVDPGRGEIEKTFWNSIERSTDVADFEAYLRTYPTGSYRVLAENQIRRMKVKPAPASAEKNGGRPAASAPTAVPADADSAMWTEVKSSGTREYYEIYLKQYAKGKYAALARLELKKLDDRELLQTVKDTIERKAATEREKQEGLRSEQEAWDRAKAIDSVTAYLTYLEAYPTGRYVALAQAAQQKAQRTEEAQEKQAEELKQQTEDQFNLGLKYEKGQGVPKNEAEAARWYRKAADQGHAGAQDNLGIMYATGQGVVKDDAEAVRWYRKAADQGDAVGQNNLGVMYDNGLGIPKDEAEAIRWYRKAADQGEANGQFNLGNKYYQGIVVPKDMAEAVRWFRKAADQGHDGAQHNLGIMYTLGIGVLKDMAEAVRWFRKAADQGHAHAKKSLTSLGL